MTEVQPPNHHADYPQFEGVFGFRGSLRMITGRRDNTNLIMSLTPNIGPGMHVVDIGCGPGHAVRTASRTGAKATGVDPSSPMLTMARALTKVRPTTGPVEWIEAGAESVPLPDDSVDVCWSLKSVHHWPQLDAGLTEVARILRPGGFFIALEKQVEPGAVGTESHGWTPAQAELLADMLRNDYGFTKVEVAANPAGKTTALTVSGQVS